ncbi:ABC transporter substrate-binding protein [Fodinisporobacter ferrooxydans]|uniref:ABC transporter substrate-binding protein n=1 Tax=Fodinisporobacter ferrooxydans TaxID=2901836 RepID=A0ABY4CF49_9BACL|nr:ABC transporter substrate-binding protein [Alicyclobacillaceae bacterium MYW30-H2]
MRGKWKQINIGFSCFLLVSLVSGCGTSATSGSQSTNVPTLVVDEANDPSTLDPGLQYNLESYTVYRNIFDNLLHRDPVSLKIVPWVAESWKQDSPTTWTFTIRNDITFQNGDKLTADDVAFSLQRILDPSLHSPQNANFSVVKSVASSGNTVTITTAKPAPTLLSELTTLSIVPKKYIQQHGNEYFNLHPIGSGPYELDKWEKGNQVVLKANTNYWKGQSEIKQVVFRSVPNDASRVADLQSGKADIAFPISPDDVQTIKGSSNLQVLSAPTERVAYLAFNVLGNTPVKSALLRRAIAYGINYPSLMSSLEHGYAQPVKEVLTPVAFGYDKNVPGFEYNPSRAKELVQQAGYSNGVTLTFATSPSYDQRIIQAIQGDLSQIGIKVNIVSTDQATYLKKIQNSSHNWGDIRMGTWSCSCMDADGTIYPLFHTGSIWSSYSNKSFDSLVDDARTNTDTNQRMKDYNQAFTILQNDVPGIGLWQMDSLYGASKRIQWKPDAQENFFVQDIKLQKK